MPERVLVKVRNQHLGALANRLASWGERRPKRIFSPTERSGSTEDGATWLLVPTATRLRGETLAALLRDLPGVEAVESDLVRPVAGTGPSDPRYAEQWSLPAIGAPEAWPRETGSSSPTTVAVIDLGVDWRHPDVAPNLWVNPGEDLDADGVMTAADLNGVDDDDNGYIDDLIGWDFVDIEGEQVVWLPDPNEDAYVADNNPMDFDGHGTRIASVALARGNNARGMAGVAWQGRIMCLRAGYRYDGQQTGGVLVSAAVEALVYAVENGARVAAAAWSSDVPSQFEQDAITWAARSGLVICAAAGNHSGTPGSASTPHYPAAYPKVISVTGVDRDHKRAYFEYSWYYGAWSPYGDWIDVCAPAVDLLCAETVSPSENGTIDFVMSDLGQLPLAASTNETYSVNMGTSYACGITAGAVALIASRYPEADAQELTYRLLSSTTDVNGANPGLEGMLGAGEVNVGATLTVPHGEAVREPALLAVDRTGSATNAVRIVHTAVPGWTYQVEARTGVHDSWQPCTDPFIADHGEFAIEWFDETGATSRFYRVGRAVEDPGTPPTL